MYARVTSIQIHPENIDQVVHIFEDSILPAARQQKGFKSTLLLTDGNTGKIVLLSFWDTEANLVAGESSGYYQGQIAKLKQFLVGPSVREVYEVSAQG